MSSFADEISSGDERRALEAMRDALADHMLRAEPNVVAQIAGRLQAVLTRLGEMEEPESEGSASDEIARRREARRAASAVAEAPAGSGIKRGRRGS